VSRGSRLPPSSAALEMRDLPEGVLDGVDVVSHQAAVVGLGVDLQDLPRFVSSNDLGTASLPPTSGSWLNMVEIFFGIITRQAIRRGTFTSVKDLIGAIEAFIDGWNDRCEPFVWTRTADEIIGKINRNRTNGTRH
jgi:hypothetical protein